MLDTENSDHDQPQQQGFLPPPTYFPPAGSGEAGGDEDEALTVLPRHTKVVVRGNNRTKSVLVGLEGVVKKAVGLGGWHWLVLTNGVEVKLQRNALTVIEPPTGQEEDDEIEIPLSSDTVLDDFPRTFKPRVRQKPAAVKTDNAPPPASATSSASPGAAPSAPALTAPVVVAVATTTLPLPPLPAPPPPPPVSQQHHQQQQQQQLRVDKAAAVAMPSTDVPVVDLSKLETAALRKYRKHFKLSDVGRNSSKEQLLRAIEKHFVAYQLDELDVITGFLQAAKRLKT